MINYTYIINQMYTVSVPSETNYVVQVNYTYTGVDGEFSSSINDSCFYNVTEGSTFVPYEDLTKDIVVGWIESSLGEDAIKNNQDCIANQIEMQKNPPVTPEYQPLPFEN